MDEKKVRSQDFFSAVYYAAASPHGELYVWNWVQEVYPELIDRSVEKKGVVEAPKI